MCSSDVIVYVANGEINGPIFIVACSDRNSGLVTSENDWAEDRAMRLWITCNYILKVSRVSLESEYKMRKHTACFQAQIPDIKSRNRWSPSCVCSW